MDRKYKINVEEMPEEIYAKNLNEAIKLAHSYIDVHEINEKGEIIDNEQDESLRTKILTRLKENNEAIDEEKLFDMLPLNHYTKEDFNKEIIKLLEDGFIFEARPKKLRYLG